MNDLEALRIAAEASAFEVSMHLEAADHGAAYRAAIVAMRSYTDLVSYLAVNRTDRAPRDWN